MRRHKKEIQVVKQKDSKQRKAVVRQAQNNKDIRKAEPKPRTDSKRTKVIGMLSRPQGITIPAIMKATGWQQHSVRGFFAGIVRKKLGFALQSEKKERADRVYRIVASAVQTANEKAAKRVDARKATKNSQQSSSSRAH
jgi:hypothetical protein